MVTPTTLVSGTCFLLLPGYPLARGLEEKLKGKTNLQGKKRKLRLTQVKSRPLASWPGYCPHVLLASPRWRMVPRRAEDLFLLCEHENQASRSPLEPSRSSREAHSLQKVWLSLRWLHSLPKVHLHPLRDIEDELTHPIYREGGRRARRRLLTI